MPIRRRGTGCHGGQEEQSQQPTRIVCRPRPEIFRLAREMLPSARTPLHCAINRPPIMTELPALSREFPVFFPKPTRLSRQGANTPSPQRKPENAAEFLPRPPMLLPYPTAILSNLCNVTFYRRVCRVFEANQIDQGLTVRLEDSANPTFRSVTFATSAGCPGL